MRKAKSDAMQVHLAAFAGPARPVPALSYTAELVSNASKRSNPEILGDHQ